MTTIVLKHREWARLRPRIDADYGKITTMISWRCRETLGFTIRHHQGNSPVTGHYDNDIRLDFVSENSAVFFRLKYL